MPRPDERLIEAVQLALAQRMEHGLPRVVFPPPRKRTGPPPTPEEAAAGILPGLGELAGAFSTFAWPYFVTAGANQRTTVVSPGITGPALIRWLDGELAETGGIQGGLSLFYATDDGGAQTNGANVAAPSGTQVFLPIGSRPSTNDVDEVPGHLAGPQAVSGSNLEMHIRLDQLVPIFGQFFLKLSLRGGTVAGNASKGILIVVTSNTLEKLESFM